MERIKDTSSQIKYIVFFTLLLVILFSCEKEIFATSNDDEGQNDSLPELPGWRLVWNDEFDGESIDTDKWIFESGGHGWGNNEAQYYTDREDNSYIEDGKLIIQALKETYQNCEYTSARINSKVGWTYKRIDVKAKLPLGVGTWPAIWMLPDDWIYGNNSWPDNGEIDIMEHVGFDPGRIHGSIHCHDYYHKIGTQKSNIIFQSDVMAKFHVYSLIWEEDSITVGIDDNYYFTFENPDMGWEKWPFDHDFHLILNLAIGGSWGGANGINNTIFPAKFEFDYVRVYERKDG